MGLTRLIGRVWRQQPDVVHFQWLVVPLLDACAIAVIQKACPVVVTIHDSVQYNGDRLSLWQRLAFLAPLRWASRVVVHTQSARTTLIGHGIPAEQIRVIPHGALSLRTAPTASPRTDPRWTFTAFGEIKPYKGLDLLVEAIALLDEAALSGVRVIIAGRPRMDLAPLLSRIAALGLSDVIDVRPRRLTEDEMAKLFGETDCFVFPYRQIDASGVYSLVKSLGRWIVATRIGIFAEDLEDGARGELIPPEDVGGLSRALAAAVGKCPTPTMISASAEWLAIGKTTRALYCEVSLERPQSAVTGGPLRRIRARGQDSPIPGPRAGISHGEH
jgi:glycosyltransferase involved in cell wall biosynthesis